MFGQTEPDLIIQLHAVTQKAGAQDTWWKPVVETGSPSRAGCARSRSGPATVKGRKITHHAIARLQQDEPPIRSTARPDDAGSARSAGTFMEWAVGKQGEMMRPNSGKLMLPGSQIIWDIHYSNGGEDVTDVVELGIYFYPKGQEPKYRQTLHLWARTNSAAASTSRRTRSRRRRASTCMRENGAHRELPAAHAPARQGDVDGGHSARTARSRC